MAKITKVQVGEALVGDGNEVHRPGYVGRDGNDIGAYPRVPRPRLPYIEVPEPPSGVDGQCGDGQGKPDTEQAADHGHLTACF